MMNFGLGAAQIVEFSPAMPYQGAFFLADKPTRLVLKPVERACQNGATLVPDNLLMVLEAVAGASKIFGKKSLRRAAGAHRVPSEWPARATSRL